MFVSKKNRRFKFLMCLTSFLWVSMVGAEIKKPYVEVKKAQVLLLPYGTFTGKVESNNRVTLSFAKSGKIIQLQSHEYPSIRKGELLAQLENPAVKSALEYAKENLAVAEKKLQVETLREQGKKKLFEKNLISKIAWNDILHTYQKAVAEKRKADYALQTAQYDSDELILKAPFDGKIAKRWVAEDQRVQAYTPIYDVYTRATMEVTFLISAPQRSWFNDAMGFNIFSLDNLTIPVATGKIDSVSSYTDPSTDLFSVKLLLTGIDNSSGLELMPGMLVKITLIPSPSLLKKREMVSVPIAALQPPQGIGIYKNASQDSSMGAASVYIYDSKTQKLKKVNVDVMGIETHDGEQWVLTRGKLMKGDQVMVSGKSGLLSGMSVIVTKQG